MMFQTPPKKKTPVINNDSIIESIRGIGQNVGKTVIKDVAGQITNDALASLLGTLPKTGEMKPNSPIEFQKEVQPEVRPMPKPEFLKPLIKSEDAMIKQKIEAIRSELKALSQSVAKLHQEIQTAVMETPVDPGIYHLNFFEQLKTVLQSLRTQVEDSRMWLSSWNTRKKKAGYWGMYKKHGTTFGMSSERSIASQAG